MEINAIAKIYTDFDTKFGIPRQSLLSDNLTGRIVFEPEYRNPDSVRGLESFSHIWLIWQFSENIREDYSPTVRPPRLGGNIRMGVFATRSPFRPNNLGLSCVSLDHIDFDCEDAPVIYVRGADLMSGTPVYDIKPYLPYSDCIPDACEGFAPAPEDALEVVFENGCDSELPDDKLCALHDILALDPRPRYQEDGREYGMSFAGKEIKFRVVDGTLYVVSISAKTF